MVTPKPILKRYVIVQLKALCEDIPNFKENMAEKQAKNKIILEKDFIKPVKIQLKVPQIFGKLFR